MRWGWIMCVVACGPVVDPPDDAGETSTGQAVDDGGPQLEGSASAPGTSAGTLPPSTTVPATTASDVSTGADTTSGSSSESSGGFDTGTGAVPPIMDPIVWPVFVDAISGAEVSAFDELMHHSPSGDERECSVCEGGSAPEIGAPIMWVNGAFAPDDSDIHVGDRVGVLFPFTDADCDIGCGASNIWVATPTSEAGGGGWVGPDAACDTESTNVYVGLDFYEVDDPGSYTTYHVRFDDVCGNQGASEAFTFVVAP